MKLIEWRPWLLGAAALVAASSSCTLLVGTFEGSGGTGATSGSGLTTSTGSLGGMSGSSSTTQGTGGQTPCSTVADCPTAANACAMATCNGVCGIQDVPKNTVLMTDTPADCHDTVCDGMGNTTKAIDLTNLPPSTNPCLKGACDANGMPGTAIVAAKTPCTTTSGGKMCDGAGACVQCLANGDCPSGQSCSTSNTCVPASCSDGVKDNAETDTDCGGGTCPACGDGKMCTSGPDCTDKVCNGTCSKPTCTDDAKNGNETDVDCGGGTCNPCGPNAVCKASSDCVGGQCGGGTCTPNCKDGVQNGTETDVDCGGGGVGCAGCAVNQKCNSDADCALGACDAVSSKCVADPCADHRLDGTETDVDCGGSCATACALGQICKLDSDCTTKACDGLSRKCVASACADDQQDNDETDVDCGGSCVPTSTCATGLKCKIDADCKSNACDANSLKCVASQCSDHQQDGTETDVDCGGSCATTTLCATGQKCKVDSDCTTKACDPVSGKCATSACTDEKVDTGETDVDCGGTTCSPCAIGKKCLVDGDCVAPQACDASSHLCVSNQCADHRADGNESDVDCGGGTCPNACAIGQKCFTGTDCVSPQACDPTAAGGPTCVANQCSDHVTDGVETDVDCGGADSCLRCAASKRCKVTSDCQAGLTCLTTKVCG